MTPGDRLVLLGEIIGVHGVQGWVKVHSDTEPREGILEYPVWHLSTRDGEWQPARLLEGRRQGKSVIASLEGVGDRDLARALIGTRVAVRRDEVPAPDRGEYYWADLEGLQVINREGRDLGRVRSLLRTGANDVMVLAGERERLVPFVLDWYVLSVDLDAGLIRVDWDEEF